MARPAATAILDSIREAIDDLAERATPTVREFSARAAEFAAVTADRAAPLAKKARRRHFRRERQAGRAVALLGLGAARVARRERHGIRAARAPDGGSPAATDVPPPPAPDAGTTPSGGATPG